MIHQEHVSISKVYNKHLITDKLALALTFVLRKECIDEDVRSKMIVLNHKIICFKHFGKNRVASVPLTNCVLESSAELDASRSIVHLEVSFSTDAPFRFPVDKDSMGSRNIPRFNQSFKTIANASIFRVGLTLVRTVQFLRVTDRLFTKLQLSKFI